MTSSLSLSLRAVRQNWSEGPLRLRVTSVLVTGWEKETTTLNPHPIKTKLSTSSSTENWEREPISVVRTTPFSFITGITNILFPFSDVTGNKNCQRCLERDLSNNFSSVGTCSGEGEGASMTTQTEWRTGLRTTKNSVRNFPRHPRCKQERPRSRHDKVKGPQFTHELLVDTAFRVV